MSWYNTNSNELISIDKSITVGNVNYPSNIFTYWSEAELNAVGIYRVVETDKPSCTLVQAVRELHPVLVDGIPTQSWEVYDMFSDTAEHTVDGVLVAAKTKEENEAEYIAMRKVDTIASMIRHFTNFTTQYIESKVSDFNKANGLAFKDIDAFTKYAVTSTSTHYAIANQFISYADRLWKAARDYQAIATAIPTDVEFKAVLDGVVF